MQHMHRRKVGCDMNFLLPIYTTTEGVYVKQIGPQLFTLT